MDPVHLIQPLTDEWIYRHQHYWSMVFRFGLISTFVLAIPWLAPPIRDELSGVVWVFPVISLIVTTLSAWLINEEWQRARATYMRIKELRGDHDPGYTRWRKGRATPRVGGFIIVLYVATLWSLAGIALALLIGS